jgi:Uma2 family endonuclease
MRTANALLTAEQLLRLPDDGLWHELVQGRLISMSPPGFAHGICGNRLGTALTNHVRSERLGLVTPQDTGFKLASDPDTVRAPDIAFVSRGRIPRGELPASYWNGAPDLAVEVLSPRESRREMDKKAREYLTSGARAVWIVNPRTRTVTIHHADSEPVAFGEHETLRDERLLPGFAYSLTELFEDLPRK